MSLLTDLTTAIRDGAVEIVDLTAPLAADTPVIQLPEPFGNTATFSLEEISHYDERGPGWYWNNICTGEHTGTHFDAPVHWVTGRRRGRPQVPVTRLIAPAAVLDFTAPGGRRPRLPARGRAHKEVGRRARPAASWRVAAVSDGLGQRVRIARPSSSTRTRRAAHPRHVGGVRTVGAPKTRRSLGIGVETVGTDAGAAHSFDPPFPCHSFVLGAGKYGLTQLQNLARLPPRGAVVIAGPLPIADGSGSPCRVIALVEHA